MAPREKNEAACSTVSNRLPSGRPASPAFEACFFAAVLTSNRHRDFIGRFVCDETSFIENAGNTLPPRILLR